MKDKIFQESLKIEHLSFVPFVNLVDGEIFLTYNVVFANNNLHLSAKCDKFSDDLYIRKTENGLVARRTFRNDSAKILKLKELGVRLEGISLGEPEILSWIGSYLQEQYEGLN